MRTYTRSQFPGLNLRGTSQTRYRLPDRPDEKRLYDMLGICPSWQENYHALEGRHVTCTSTCVCRPFYHPRPRKQMCCLKAGHDDICMCKLCFDELHQWRVTQGWPDR